MYENANSIIEIAINEGRNVLTQEEAKIFASDLDISCPLSYIAKDKNDAVRLADELGYPVILKILSHKIIHKSDIGGVEKNLQNTEDVVRGYKKVLCSVRKIDDQAQVVVEKMMPAGLETIVGLITEPGFGPVLMVGLGGVLTELFEDIIFRLTPIDAKEAQKAIDSLRASKLFYGYRGQSPVDVKALSGLLVKISRVPQWFKNIEQMDLNPVILYKNGLSVVDVKVILKKQKNLLDNKK